MPMKFFAKKESAMPRIGLHVLVLTGLFIVLTMPGAGAQRGTNAPDRGATAENQASARFKNFTPVTDGMLTLAIYGDKIVIATNDAHLVALDARTGEVMWDQRVADAKLGYRYTSGPIIAKGKIIAGITGCEHYKDDICFISAHDPQTGKELWRTSTVARPGEPGGESWGDLPLNRRAGSDVWINGSYDPKLNLVFFSTAQAKPWARVSRKTDGDALYTNCTLALDPDTGKIVWYHQFTPGETHDLDDVFENTLIDYDG